jgi:hypothetical protein
MKTQKINTFFICILILGFFIFFIFTEFILFLYTSPVCSSSNNNIKEGFNKTCIDPNVIHLTDMLLDNLDPITKVQQMNQIRFTSSESGNFKPILQATVKNMIPDTMPDINMSSKLKPSDLKIPDTTSTSSSDLDPELKIEYLKYKIIQEYILNCNDTNYTSMSKIQDIKYLNCSNLEIQNALKSRNDPSHKILDIVTILNNLNNSYI